MMGRHHVRILMARDDIDLVAVVDPLGDPNGYARGVPILDSTEAAIELGLDCCVVAVPTEDHHKVALMLAEGHVPTLIEKPLAATVTEGNRIVSAFAAAGVPGCVGHVERCNAAMRSLRQRLENEELGELYQITTSRQGPFPNRIRDVGVVKDLATHDIDLTAWIANASYEAVAAHAAHRTGRVHEDLVAVVGWLSTGVVTNHVVNWLSPVKERRLVVTGERGCFVANLLSADLTFFNNASVRQEWDALEGFRGISEGDMIRYAISKREPLAVEIDEFLCMVRGKGGNVVSFEEGLVTLTVAEAVLQSASTGQVVRMDAL
jgi:UDP-N-acetylglucosamine 3-dehydrogenase